MKSQPHRMMSRRERRAALPLLASLIVACTGEPTPPPNHAGRGPRDPVASAAPSTDATAEPAIVVPDDVPPPIVPAADAPFSSRTPELTKFHAALNELEKKTRKDHVRVLWLGDSHGQADFWSGQLRKSLSERFGKGGPGYVHLGYKNYRHDGLKLDIRGKWRMRPKKPVSPKRQGDGVYGLGGLMMSGYDDSPRVELTLADLPPSEQVRYDLCYRFVEKDDALAISIGGAPEKTFYAKDVTRNVVEHMQLTGKSEEAFVVRPIGRTDLCGVVVETDPAKRPGVVVDTLAINGARYGTALAWDGAAWQSEVARRKPNLVVLEYGTNEAGDLNPAYAKVGKQVGELLGRVRAVSPDVECIVVSPTDRGDAESKVTEMRKSIMASAKELGCFWFDPWELLGGEGAFKKLAQTPDGKVQKDEIHLTIKGYRELGKTMFESVMSGYGPAASTAVSATTNP